jgi:hypothetical protein
MKKNIFEIGQEEKNRILNLHESATKNLYLKEDDVMSRRINPLGYGNLFLFFYDSKNESYQKKLNDIMKNLSSSDEWLNLKSRIDDFHRRAGAYDNKIRREIGNFVIKHKDVMNELVTYVESLGYIKSEFGI